MDRRLLAALVLPLVLAACGNDDPSSSTTSEEASSGELSANSEKAFVKPLFTKDDVVLTELQVGDGVATVLVGSELVPDLTTLYQFMLVEDDWLVSGDEYNTEGL